MALLYWCWAITTRYSHQNETLRIVMSSHLGIWTSWAPSALSWEGSSAAMEEFDFVFIKNKPTAQKNASNDTRYWNAFRKMKSSSGRQLSCEDLRLHVFRMKDTANWKLQQLFGVASLTVFSAAQQETLACCCRVLATGLGRDISSTGRSLARIFQQFAATLHCRDASRDARWK